MSAPASHSSHEITRRSRSNLAFALACLPAERRRDMTTFYAFCRVVDDIADDATAPAAARRAELDRWIAEVRTGAGAAHPVLAELAPLPAKYNFPREWLVEIIEGVASDLGRDRYATIEELLAYCYKVASVVGLVSARIFGCQHPDSEAYAIHLGYALQLTNIIRDVGQDARESGRIYLPQADLAAHGVTEQQILDGRHDERFLALMEHEYQRARHYYELAAAQLPAADRRALIAARMMGQIYRELLEKLRRERYPVLRTRVRLHPLRKAMILGGYWLRGLLG